MTKDQHHELCIGLLNLLYDDASPTLKRAIREAVAAARDLRFYDVDPDNLGTGLPLCMNQ